MTDIGRQAVVEHIGQAGAPGPGTVLLLGGAGGRLGVLLGRVMPATEREDETAEMQLVLRIDTILPAILLVAGGCRHGDRLAIRSEEHTSELQSLMRISYAVFCLNKNTHHNTPQQKIL